MRARRTILVLMAAVMTSGCSKLVAEGFSVGDISGLWVANSYAFTPSLGGQAVDLVARDGATFFLSVDNTQNPQLVSTTFDDGAGGQIEGGGTVDLVLGTLTILGETYQISHDRSRMTLVNGASSFDFGGGATGAVHTIQLDRL